TPSDPNIDVDEFQVPSLVPVSPAIHEFEIRIRNTGTSRDLVVREPLINGPDADRFSIADLPRTVFAGDKTTIKLRFDTRGEARLFRAWLTLRSNDPEPGDANLAVLVEIEAVSFSSALVFQSLGDPDDLERVRDLSGRGHDGLLEAAGEAAFELAAPSFLSDITSLAVEKGGNIRVPASTFSGVDSFSMSLWIYPHAVSGLQSLISKGGGESPEFGLFLRDGQLLWAERDSIRFRSASDSVRRNEAHHVVVTYDWMDGGLTHLFLDGELVGSHAGEIAVSDPTDLFIGAYDGEIGYSGRLNYFQAYERALSAGEAAWLFANPSGVVEAPPASDPGDADADGLLDEWERALFGSLDQLTDGDPDGDGLTNEEEFLIGSHPLRVDTDRDGASDFYEVLGGYDPLEPSDAGGTGTIIDALIGWWSFDEVAGRSVPNESLAAPLSDLRFFGGATAVEDAGRPGVVAQLPGWEDSLLLGEASGGYIFPAGQALSISLWFHNQGVASEQGLFTVGFEGDEPSKEGWLLLKTLSEGISFEGGDGNGNALSFRGIRENWASHRWGHLALVRDPTTASWVVYLDGEEVARQPTAGVTLGNESSRAVLGWHSDQFARGMVDDVAVWNGHALSADEVRFIREEGVPALFAARGDEDGDGFSNVDEKLAGTDPGSNGDGLLPSEVRLVGDGIAFEWDGQPDRIYGVEYSETGDAGSWTIIEEWEAVPAGTLLSFAEKDARRLVGKRGFYRIRVEPVPGVSVAR
ncbi:MAG: LamG-like jellyroll fold domain-containing protein, partial [Verrucomicrobiota bacterium]